MRSPWTPRPRVPTRVLYVGHGGREYLTRAEAEESILEAEHEKKVKDLAQYLFDNGRDGFNEFDPESLIKTMLLDPATVVGLLGVKLSMFGNTPK